MFIFARFTSVRNATNVRNAARNSRTVRTSPATIESIPERNRLSAKFAGNRCDHTEFCVSPSISNHFLTEPDSTNPRHWCDIRNSTTQQCKARPFYSCYFIEFDDLPICFSVQRKVRRQTLNHRDLNR